MSRTERHRPWVATAAALACAVAFASSPAPLRAQAAANKGLQIYVVDVEGGNATLFVGPTGQSLLIDTGNGDAAAPRDAARIMEAINDAGLKQIDHLIITHYHGDHLGGLSSLAPLIPIKHFIDHGENVQADGSGVKFIPGYRELAAKAQHTVAKPGDTIALGPGIEVRVVASAGEIIKTPLSGAGAANPACATFKPSDNNAEDPMSVAVRVSYGKFRTVHLGDLTRNKEFELMCPNNRIGTVDLMLGLHHGQATSNSAVAIHALHPRVAIMNNGTRKGGEPDTMQSVFSSPGLEDLWQMHFSLLSGQEYTVPGAFIANQIDQPDTAIPVAAWTAPAAGQQIPPAPVHNGKSYYFKVSAQADGTFTVTNTRNQFTKRYRPGDGVNATR